MKWSDVGEHPTITVDYNPLKIRINVKWIIYMPIIPLKSKNSVCMYHIHQHAIQKKLSKFSIYKIKVFYS